jgi:type IV pilus assembly protein PilW
MKYPSLCTRSLLTQRGFSLIEVMVSLTIGLVIMIAIGAAYFNSSNLSRQRENQTELNEPARIVMRMLQQNVSTAGYVDIFDFGLTKTPQAGALFVPGKDSLVNLYQRVPEATPLATPLGQFFPGMLPIFGCDGAMNSSPNALVQSAATVVLACGTANTTKQTLQVAYQSTPSALTNTMVSLLPSSSTTGDGHDCIQQNPPTGAIPPRNKFVVNRFYVADNDGVNELYCAGSGNSIPQPIARGVEEFMLRYQLAQPGVAPVLGSTGIAAGSAQAKYVNASTVSDVATNPIGWANVTAVEICIVSATAATGSAAAGTAQVQPSRPTCSRNMDGTYAPNVARLTGDTQLWKRFTSVVSVRNAVYSTPF